MGLVHTGSMGLKPKMGLAPTGPTGIEPTIGPPVTTTYDSSWPMRDKILP